MRKRDISSAALVAALVALVVFFALAAILAGRGSETERLKSVERAIRRAAVNCYAIEGAYPETVAYMEAHYGLSVDETRYLVYYDLFASNVMPSVTVIDAGGETDGD